MVKGTVQCHPSDSNQGDGTSGMTAGDETISSLVRGIVGAATSISRNELPKKLAYDTVARFRQPLYYKIYG